MPPILISSALPWTKRVLVQVHARTLLQLLGFTREPVALSPPYFLLLIFKHSFNILFLAFVFFFL